MSIIKDNSQEVEQTMHEYMVVKSNDLIQKSRFQLSLQEQKIILYLISKIKPDDEELKEYTFKIVDFCTICGIEKNSGANYKYIKQTLKTLADKSVWIQLADGRETLIRWINKVWINEQSGNIQVRLDDDMKPYLLQLQERFTQYELLYTLAMKSQYSIRLYELLKSYEYQHQKIFDIDNLKKLLAAENYERYPDFKRKVLDISMKEINELSDINVSYDIIKDGKRYAKLEFYIKIKEGAEERIQTWARIDRILNPFQISMFGNERVINQ